MSRGHISVLIIDDSKFMAKKLEEILWEDPEILEVKKAHGGEEALDVLARFRPSCITLDVHMPGMNGLTVLKHIMIRCPTPTLMVSSYTGEGAWITFDALRYGAVDFYKKPSGDSPEAIEGEKKTLVEKVKRASRVRVEAARFIRIGARRPQPWIEEGEEHGEKKGRIDLFLGGTGGYSSVLQLLSLASPYPQREYMFYLDVPTSCLEGFSRYVGASFGLKTTCLERSNDGKSPPQGRIKFLNDPGLLEGPLSGERDVRLIGLSGERPILDRFIGRFGSKIDQLLALEPGLCLVPDMAEGLISQGAKVVSYLDLAKYLEG